MNERIRELADEADGVFIHKLMTGAKQYTFLEKDLEKFAQLIVQECAALAKSKSEHIQSIETADHDDQIQLHSLAWQFEEFGYAIKKHFGVE